MTGPVAVSCEDRGEHLGSLKATAVADRLIACHYVTIHPISISIPLTSTDCTLHADPILCPCTLTTTTVTSLIFLLTFAKRLEEVKYIRHAKTAWLLEDEGSFETS
jgi:hypothetical protein